MSYNSEYQEWVEKFIKKKESQGQADTTELYQVHRGVPILRIRVKENPPQYRFRAPLISGRMRDLDRLRVKVDQRLDGTPGADDRKRASMKASEVQRSDEISYYLNWQNCQFEIEKMRRRETGLISKLDELQKKVSELGSGVKSERARTRAIRENLQSDMNKVEDYSSSVDESKMIISELRREVAGLRNQLKASEAKISDLKNKLTRLQAR
jgi:chromosome segregation ATPase